jgi:signal peptidase
LGQRVLKWLTNIVIIIVALLAIIGLLLPALFSARSVIVYSGSMEPTLPVGCLAVISPVEPASIKIGDIIAFHPTADPKVTIAHRVVEIIEGTSLSFRTKGDANDAADMDSVPAANLVGRITWDVPYIGYGLDRVNDFVRTIWGLVLLVCVPTVLIFYNTIKEMIYPVNLRQKRKELLVKRRQQWRAHTR